MSLDPTPPPISTNAGQGESNAAAQPSSAPPPQGSIR